MSEDQTAPEQWEYRVGQKVAEDSQRYASDRRKRQMGGIAQ